MSENAQAMEAIASTGPGQHFLGSEHTQANFMTALFRPWTPDDNSFEQWHATGEKDAAASFEYHLERAAGLLPRSRP